MSTGPMFDQFWLFVAGVVAVPLGVAYATAAAVRWRAATQGFALDASRRSLFALAIAVYLGMLLAGGFILSALHGIPPGIGFFGTLAFLVAVYGGPLAVGTYLFARVVSARLSPSDGGESRTRVVAETGVLFAGFHVAVFPSVFAVAIAAS